MPYKLRWLVFIFCLMSISIAKAETKIYKTLDENGVITYSDQPSTNSQPVTLIAPQVYTPPTTKTVSFPITKSKKSPIESAYISIIEPKDQMHFDAGSGKIKLTVEVKPSLHRGDQIQLYVDNIAVGEPQTKRHFMIELTRGQHLLMAKVLCSHTPSHEIQSSPITVYQFKPDIKKSEKKQA